MAPKRECPHCEGWFQAHTWATHVPVCELRPSDDELIQMRLDGMSREAIADFQGVSHFIVSKWLAACGADKIIVKRRWASDITVCPEKALRYGQEGGCNRCPDLELCAELERAGERVRCEAPDKLDLVDEQAQRNGKPRLEPGCNTSAWETVFAVTHRG